MLMRDVYYTLKDIFSTQEECNRCILELGRYLRLKRRECLTNTVLYHISVTILFIR